MHRTGNHVGYKDPFLPVHRTPESNGNRRCRVRAWCVGGTSDHALRKTVPPTPVTKAILSAAVMRHIVGSFPER